MKRFLVIILLTCFNLNFCRAQRDSVIAARTSQDTRPIECVVIINNYIIYDTAVSYPLLIKVAGDIERKKTFSVVKGYKKYGILSRDGILFCTLKPGIKFELKNVPMVSSSR